MRPILLGTPRRVIGYSVKIKVKKDGSGVDKANVAMAMNPFCEIAAEEAIRFKEAGHVDEVVAVTMGPEKASETLRTALAMGADRGVHVVTDADLEPLAVAKMLAKVVEQEAGDIVFVGKQAIDDDCNHTGQMVAGMLGWSQGTFASEIKLSDCKSKIEVIREVDDGLQTINLTMPTVISADLRLNEPRYPKLPNIIKAKKKPVTKMTPEELGVDVSPRLTIINVAEPSVRQAGITVDSVGELVEKLKNDAQVL